MTRWRQRYLGVTPQGTLHITTARSPRGISPEPIGYCFISTLPDELLLEVFSYLPPKTSKWTRNESEDLAPLTLVCKTWRRVYESILFSRIEYHSGCSSRINYCRQPIVDLLESRSYLRSYVRTINLFLWKPSRGVLKSVIKIIEFCSAARSVTIQTDLTAQSWPLLHAVKRMPLLKTLHLHGHSSGPSVYLILCHLDIPTLKCLTASRFGAGKSATSLASIWGPPNAEMRDYELDGHFPPERYHTRNITSLGLSDPCAHFNVAERIMRMPAYLKELSINCLTHSWYASSYTTRNIEYLLGIHRKSLKHITLGVFCEKSMPDLSNFPKLETIRMSAYNSIKAETPTTALKKLAAPALRFLYIDFGTEDQHPEIPSDFCQDQLDWMTEFAQLRLSDYPDSMLQRVFISFNPYDASPDEYYDPSTDKTWPWEYVQQANQMASQHGLILDYSKPTYTKEEWDKAVVKYKQGVGEVNEQGGGAETDEEMDEESDEEFDEQIELEEKGLQILTWEMFHPNSST